MSLSISCWAGGAAFVPTPGPGGGVVHSLFRDSDGTVYAGTNAGVFQQTAGQTQWRALGSALGLNNRPLAITRGADGTLYIGTDSGAYVL
ncbi:MAG: two-component regulator propeller domain-containing protein, partial [Rhodoferax sp.]|nr:two-component regulator propeller domain-containing protein [Rhodoferax sp.]